MGGKSSEHEISVISGEQVCKALGNRGYEVTPIKLSKDGKNWDEINKLRKVDICFIAIHGKNGEDGTIQGMLEIMGVKYTGCRVLASALGMDKLMFRKFLDSLSIKHPKEVGLKPKKFPVFVKPNCGGSSVGVTKVKKVKELKSALKLAFKYDKAVLVEEAIEGREFTCGVIGNLEKQEVLPVVEIVPEHEFFDYESKYESQKTQEVVPAKISKKISDKLQEISRKIFVEIGAKGFFRVDFMMDKNNQPYVLEINTIPGLTPMSLMPKAAKAAGYSYEDFIEKVVWYSL